jgi:TetR/AcrR family tetracycline transcriptional repressor
MPPREPLTREKVLVTAMELARTDGLEGLSMRRLAKALGVEAMSLYNHVANKTDLLDAIAARVFAEAEPADPALPWAERVRAVALGMFRAFSRHPFVPLALVTDRANPTTVAALKPIDDVAGALYEAGFDDAGVRQALNAVTGLLMGAVLAATAGFSSAPGRHPEPELLDPYVRRLDPAKLPHFSRLVSTLAEADAEEDFTHALDLLMGGLVAAAPNGSAGRPPKG